jgi:hypothetical protein
LFVLVRDIHAARVLGRDLKRGTLRLDDRGLPIGREPTAEIAPGERPCRADRRATDEHDDRPQDGAETVAA